MCGKPLRAGYAYSNRAAVQHSDRLVDLRTFLIPVGVIAAMIVGGLIVNSLINLNRKPTQTRIMPPIPSTTSLPPVSQLTDIVRGYADEAKKEDSDSSEGNNTLKDEKDALLAIAAQRLGQGNATSVGPQVANPPSPTPGQLTVPAGEVVIATSASQEFAYIEALELSNQAECRGTISIVNPRSVAIDNLDLTLQVGDQLFPVKLGDKAKSSLSPRGSCTVSISAEPLGPLQGPRRLILRSLYTDRNEPNLDFWTINQ